MKFLTVFLMFIATDFALAAESNSLMRCKKGSNSHAVVVTQNKTPGENPYFVSINDSEIIRALNLGDGSFYFSSPSKTARDPNKGWGYLALSGEYSTGVILYGDYGGVKLVLAASTSEGIKYYTDKNWYFNPGECTRE